MATLRHTAPTLAQCERRWRMICSRDPLFLLPVVDDRGRTVGGLLDCDLQLVTVNLPLATRTTVGFGPWIGEHTMPLLPERPPRDVQPLAYFDPISEPVLLFSLPSDAIHRLSLSGFSSSFSSSGAEVKRNEQIVSISSVR